MTKESLKKLEAKVFATDLKEGVREPRKSFDKEAFLKAAIAIQKSTEERDKDADTSTK